MMHPDTALAYISPERGFGVVARKNISKGTLIYVLDPLDIIVEPDDARNTDPLYTDLLTTYAYTEPNGTRILCWDHGKYMNHCCQPNTLSTGFGFEIAIRDIVQGEEVTDHYALLNLEYPMDLQCHKEGCNGRIIPGELAIHHAWMDERIREALADLRSVPQPLYRLLDPSTRNSLERFLDHGHGYPTVLSLHHPLRDAM
jgi:uncharacterized protein